tara:strand:- start:30037 stop:30567 length:531 start_codon:yes stop_codon:yes gene_type:complete
LPPEHEASRGRGGHFFARARDALPSPFVLISGALFWGCAMALSLYAGLEVMMGGFTSHRTALIALYFAGGTIAFPMALYTARFLGLRRPAEVRFASAFVCLIVATIAFTSGLYAIIYWNFYASWAGDFLSIAWAYQLAFTTASALFQFAVIGLRYFLPVGLVCLIATSFWIAKRMR